MEVEEDHINFEEGSSVENSSIKSTGWQVYSRQTQGTGGGHEETTATPQK